MESKYSNKVFCLVGEKNGVKYMSIDKGDVLKIWNQIFIRVKYINKISYEEVNFNSDYDKIKFVSDDSLPLGKFISFPILTVVIRCIFKQGDLFYPHVYLDDALYQL